MKKVLKIQDLSFYPDKSSSKYHVPQKIEWDRTHGKDSVVFFTDACLSMASLPIYRDSFKIAWILEPYAINPYPYQNAVAKYGDFDLILSHHDKFVSKMEGKGAFYPNGMSWVAEDDWMPYTKSMNLSIIASAKSQTEGQKLRHQYIEWLNISSDSALAFGVDKYGYGYNPVEHKIEALREYRFSVAIENSKVNTYFSEKLLDCFATYTIPVYWGCENVKDYFNPDGIIQVDSIDDLLKYTRVISESGKEIYNKRSVQSAMKDNFEEAKKYRVAEDWIYENILVPKQLV